MQHETKRGQRRKPGRPRLSKAEKQGARLVVNLRADEFEQFREAAGEESLSGYARRVLVRHLARRKR